MFILLSHVPKLIANNLFREPLGNEGINVNNLLACTSIRRKLPAIFYNFNTVENISIFVTFSDEPSSISEKGLFFDLLSAHSFRNRGQNSGNDKHKLAKSDSWSIECLLIAFKGLLL